ncbi:hypothetical protein [Saccharothrix variisporea]|uniref:Uncharacterized protein n=1 Tax=Saccharothrix variisporea TaxID=543527 RepID=A0A495X067_9PSEU|nr:hypothetical protein [Saccharothrix variisporea]RKT67342.1 hypothetical protein DFJ66_0517 [Saccharothrix variisporea]
MNYWVGRADVPWARRWEELAAAVAELSAAVLAGPGGRQLAEQVAETLLAGIGEHRGHRAELAGLVDRVLDLHAVACATDPPEPEQLARWLLHVQTDYPEPPDVRLAPYAAALGPEGLAWYRREAVARFERLPVIGYGRTGHYDRERWALLRVVEELAEHTRDVDLHVLVLARDLSSGWHYLQVATVLRDAGRSEEALEWVARGLTATGGRGAAGRLVDLAVDECLRAGTPERALRWRREAFLAWPTPENYLRLRGLAVAQGVWPAVRDEVLAAVTDTALRDRLARHG